jgi:tetratricopeptide (TPR) repeat protein
MKKTLTLLAVAMALMVSGTTTGQPSPQLQCTPQLIDQALVDNDLDSALKLTQDCIVKDQAELEATAGAFLIAKVEILALKGTLPEAESALEEAEKFDQKHPRAAMSWSLVGAPLPTARAFILEKKGNLDGATAAYNSILVALKQDGWPNASNVIHGRLAIVSLMKGDEAAAERWCKDSLSNDPGANAARGALLKRMGDNPGAKQHYAAALKLMTDAANRKNWSLPIYFAELKRAKDGLDK